MKNHKEMITNKIQWFVGSGFLFVLELFGVSAQVSATPVYATPVYTTPVYVSPVYATVQQEDSLAYYIQVAIENNPGVKSQAYAHGASLEKIPQAGALPDPELSLEAYTEPMEIIGGRSLGNVGLMQMLPWFGTKKAARAEAVHRARVQEQRYRETINGLVLEVRARWYAMQALKEQLKFSRENKELLDQLEQLALRGMGAGAGSGMSEVLRIQLEAAELENRMESLRAQLQAEKARFNALLNREANAGISLSPEMRKVPVLFNEEETLAALERNNPTLGMISEEGLAFKAKAKADRKMSQPRIGLGVQYMVIGQTDEPMFAMGDMNGNDMIMPMVSVSLPLFRKKYNAQQRESELWRKSAAENYRNTLNTLRGEYYRLKSQLDDADRALNLYEKQTNLAETAYRLIVKEFVSGKSDLTQVLEVQRQLLDYQLRQAEALASYNTTAASIEQLIATQ